MISLKHLGLADDGKRFSYCGRNQREGSQWLMANQAGWNTGQDYLHTLRSRSVRSQMPHTHRPATHTHTPHKNRNSEETRDIRYAPRMMLICADM